MLKTLGEAYLPKSHEQHIADRNKFPNAVWEELKTANPIEKIQITVLDMVVEVNKSRTTTKRVVKRVSKYVNFE